MNTLEELQLELLRSEQSGIELVANMTKAIRSGDFEAIIVAQSLVESNQNLISSLVEQIEELEKS